METKVENRNAGGVWREGGGRELDHEAKRWRRCALPPQKRMTCPRKEEIGRKTRARAGVSGAGESSEDDERRATWGPGEAAETGERGLPTSTEE